MVRLTWNVRLEEEGVTGEEMDRVGLWEEWAAVWWDCGSTDWGSMTAVPPPLSAEAAVTAAAAAAAAADPAVGTCPLG